MKKLLEELRAREESEEFLLKRPEEEVKSFAQHYEKYKVLRSAIEPTLRVLDELEARVRELYKQVKPRLDEAFREYRRAEKSLAVICSFVCPKLLRHCLPDIAMTVAKVLGVKPEKLLDSARVGIAYCPEQPDVKCLAAFKLDGEVVERLISSTGELAKLLREAETTLARKFDRKIAVLLELDYDTVLEQLSNVEEIRDYVNTRGLLLVAKPAQRYHTATPRGTMCLETGDTSSSPQKQTLILSLL